MRKLFAQSRFRREPMGSKRDTWSLPSFSYYRDQRAFLDSLDCLISRFVVSVEFLAKLGGMADSEEAKVPEEQPEVQENVETEQQELAQENTKTEQQETEPQVEAPTETETADPETSGDTDTKNGESETAENGEKAVDPVAAGDVKEEAEEEDDEDDRYVICFRLTQ